MDATVINKLNEEKEEMIKRYATNEAQEEYILYLGLEVFQQVSEVIDFMEGDSEELPTFHDVQEQAMVTCIHTFDFETENIINNRFPQVKYTMLHLVASGSDYTIEQDEKGTTIKISMLPEQHMIMALLNTLDGLIEYIYEQGVADQVLIFNIENNEEF